MLARLKSFLQPISTNVTTGEKLLSGLLAFAGIYLLGLICAQFIGDSLFPYLIASAGASAVLVFAVPHSPLSQPWPVFAGHIVSATIGVTCHLIIEDLALAAAVAVAGSIVVMYFLRCLHPPGGAAALGAVLAGPEIHALGFSYVISPVALNAILIVFLAVILNRLVPRRHYPAVVATKSNKTLLSDVATEWAMGPARFKDSDLEAALQNMESYIDVSQEDLTRIYALAVMNANKRRLGEVRCADIMTTNPITFRFDDELQIAWNRLRQHNIKAAPIVDSFDRPLGIVTTTDFMHHASAHEGSTFRDQFKSFLRRSPGHSSDKHEVVGQIMSKTLTTARPDQHIIDLVPVFTEKGFHHMPIVNAEGKIVGMVTRSDVMRSMVLVRT